MTVLLIFTLVITNLFTGDDDADTEIEKAKPGAKGETSTKDMKELHHEFNSFRHKYLVVYLIIMLADWMQGTHMYTLYLSYNVNISALFLTGFFSGAVFAPFLGSAVDKFGRKRSCIVYCVLEIIINTLEHSTDFTILLIGRVLGGMSYIYDVVLIISSSLLYIAMTNPTLLKSDATRSLRRARVWKINCNLRSDPLNDLFILFIMMCIF
jgi:hypothetical protein